MKASRKAAFLSLAAFAAPFAEASDIDTRTRRTVADNQRFSVDVFTGVLNNRSTERVYDEGQRLSQLNWRTRAAPVIGADFRFHINDRWSWDTQAWTKLKSGNTLMTDYDWLGRDAGINEWTDYSRHGDTRLKTAYGLDTRVGYTFASSGDFAFRAVAGYRLKKLAWHATKGSYIYSSSDPEEAFDPESFRDTVGYDNDGSGVKYTQRWRAPYLGMGTDYQRGKLTLSGEISGSLWARGKDHDNHIEREYVSGMKGGRSKMIAASIKADYAIDSRWSLFARTSYEKYYEKKGLGKGHIEGEAVAFRASMSNRSMIVNLGASYRF